MFHADRGGIILTPVRHRVCHSASSRCGRRQPAIQGMCTRRLSPRPKRDRGVANFGRGEAGRDASRRGAETQAASLSTSLWVGDVLFNSGLLYSLLTGGRRLRAS